MNIPNVGSKVVTAYGTGFVTRIGAVCNECNCGCDDDATACAKNVPMVQVEMNGGGFIWFEPRRVTEVA